MNVFSHTADRVIDTRRESYYFLTPTPQNIGDVATIEVEGLGTRVVRLEATKGVVYCNTWLVETEKQ
jgi:hypothetical protein